MITIVDYNMGNLGSIRNMLLKLGLESEVTADPARLRHATKLILPGVGSFDAGMASLEASGLTDILNERVLIQEVPVLGICLGMQLMTKRSDEGSRHGLGWIDAETRRFQPSSGAEKIPHMGWNLAHKSHSAPLVDRLPEEPRFYFVHSYYIHCHRPEDVLLTTSYGHDFHSAFHHRNVWGVQFHPEKSHKFGMAILKNFAELC